MKIEKQIMTSVDLNLVTDNGKILYLSGKNKGLSARTLLKVSELDIRDESIPVIIPNGFTCNESFLSGLFSNSIYHFKDRTKFLSHYQFTNLPNALKTKLDNVITATLSKGTALSKLGK